MKRLIIALLASTLTVGCASHTVLNGSRNGAKDLPPGQAKKVYGTQSAKPFAPGQQKQKNLF